MKQLLQILGLGSAFFAFEAHTLKGAGMGLRSPTLIDSHVHHHVNAPA
jgi:hypothetical protein